MPSSGDAHHVVKCRVVLSNDPGWDVYTELDGRLLSITHCTDWHRVERLLALIKADAALGRQPIEIDH
jgi:hypothetical protein